MMKYLTLGYFEKVYLLMSVFSSCVAYLAVANGRSAGDAMLLVLGTGAASIIGARIAIDLIKYYLIDRTLTSLEKALDNCAAIELAAQPLEDNATNPTSAP